MRIDKIEIDGFGKLNNFSLSLTDGFNLIYGENESGKSTLCTFLLSMFYEMPNDKKSESLSESVRRKYKPWHTERFGGRVHFTHDGKSYVLEKSFGATKRSDRARLLNGKTWEECGDGENAGEQFFGLGREGFLKTLCISGLYRDDKGQGNEEILMRLSNMETSGDEDVSYANIRNALEKEQLSILSKTGKGGKLASLKEEKIRLEMEMGTKSHAEERIKIDKERERKLENSIDEHKERLESLEKDFQCALRHEQFVVQRKTEETRKLTLENIEREQKKLLEIEQEIASLSQQEQNFVKKEDTERALVLEKQLEQLKLQKETAEQEQLKAYKIQADATKRRHGFVMAAMIVFVLFTLTGILLQHIFSPLILSGIGVILGAILLILSKRNNDEKFSEFPEKMNALLKEIQDKEKETATLCAIYKTENLNGFFARAAQDTSSRERLDALKKERLTTQEELMRQTNNANSFKMTEEQTFTQEEMQYSGEDSQILSEKIRREKEQIEDMSQTRYELSMALAKESAGERSTADIASDIALLDEQIVAFETRYRALQKAGKWLARAHEEIQQNYAPRLNEKTADIFSCLTQEKYDGVKVGEGFHLNYRNEQNQIVDGSYLSSGTYDLLYISLRFAAMSVLFDDKIPPVIADDALLQLDDERLQTCAEFMTKAPFGQVLYFTCHGSGVKLFENMNIHNINLNLGGTTNELQN